MIGQPGVLNNLEAPLPPQNPEPVRTNVMDPPSTLWVSVAWGVVKQDSVYGQY